MSRSNASRNGSGSTMIYPITLVHRTGSTPGWGQLLLVVAGLRLNDDLLARPDMRSIRVCFSFCWAFSRTRWIRR